MPLSRSADIEVGKPCYALMPKHFGAGMALFGRYSVVDALTVNKRRAGVNTRRLIKLQAADLVGTRHKKTAQFKKGTGVDRRSP